MQQQIEIKAVSTKYQLASASRRIFARAFDLLLLAIISLAICFAIFNDQIFNTSNTANNFSFYDYILNKPVKVASVPIESWKAIVFCLIVFVLHFSYFVILPWVWKGQTLFKKAFKIRTVERKKVTLFFWHLILKESFIWFYQLLVVLVFLAIKQPDNVNKIYDSFILANVSSSDASSIIFRILSIVGSIFSIILFIATIARTKKINIHDRFSCTAVVLQKPYVENANNEKIAPEINLPGKNLDKKI